MSLFQVFRLLACHASTASMSVCHHIANLCLTFRCTHVPCSHNSLDQLVGEYEAVNRFESYRNSALLQMQISLLLPIADGLRAEEAHWEVEQVANSQNPCMLLL